MRALILGLMLATAMNCHSVEKLQADGHARATIIAPEFFEVTTPNAVVYTAEGPTLQVIF